MKRIVTVLVLALTFGLFITPHADAKNWAKKHHKQHRRHHHHRHHRHHHHAKPIPVQ